MHHVFNQYQSVDELVQAAFWDGSITEAVILIEAIRIDGGDAWLDASLNSIILATHVGTQPVWGGDYVTFDTEGIWASCPGHHFLDRFTALGHVDVLVNA